MVGTLIAKYGYVCPQAELPVARRQEKACSCDRARRGKRASAEERSKI